MIRVTGRPDSADKTRALVSVKDAPKVRSLGKCCVQTSSQPNEKVLLLDATKFNG